MSHDRIGFDEQLGSREIKSLARNPNLGVLQTSTPVPSHLWTQLNDDLFKHRPDVELRVYGFYGKVCDLSFAKLVPNVHRFSADCLINATGVETVATLPNLERLSIGIYNLDNFDFLQHVNPQRMKDLSLQATKSKKPTLYVLERFPNLERLYLEGQQKGIETISKLSRLQDLTLRSITVDSLDFLQPLTDLWSLDIKLGGTKNLEALRCLKKLKYLELWQIKGLTDLTPISEMTGLQYLFLQSLLNVDKLPDLSQLTNLRKVYLDTMKGLTDLSPLEGAHNLDEFVHVVARGFKPHHYKGLIEKGNLKRCWVGTGSQRANDAIHTLITSAGISLDPINPFRFV